MADHRKVCDKTIITHRILCDGHVISFIIIYQGARGQSNYDKLEEALRKHNPSDLESGIEHASLLIDEYTNDAKLYLLRAKLFYKLLVSVV